MRTHAERIAAQILGVSRAEEDVHGLPEAAWVPRQLGRVNRKWGERTAVWGVGLYPPLSGPG